MESSLDLPTESNEIHPSEIHEFHLMNDLADDSGSDWMPHMQQLSEDTVKRRICEILGDEPRKDWGGEWNDHFASIHIDGRQYKASFLFKGPARFREMKPSDLGKNADQIYRLSATPCDVMIIQHCHRIGEAVRATVQAFAALDPLRKYCLIDGQDTFRILKAYGKL